MKLTRLLVRKGSEFSMNHPQQRKTTSKGKKSIGTILVGLLLVIAAYFFDIDIFKDEPIAEGQIPVELIRTIDGDTITVTIDGEERSIRYLLIDTPEIDHKNPANTEPFARKATERNDELLRSGQVTIEFDEGDREDQYGRLLAYIYVDGKSVQKSLLEEGYARVAYVFEPNIKYIDEFNAAVQKAKDAKRGIWEREGYVTNRGFDTSVYGQR